MRSSAKILIQAIGNPLRSDDAVGPLLIERLSDEATHRFDDTIELEWVYQLQIENAEQWHHYEKVIVIDADSRAAEPLSWRELTEQRNVAHETFDSHQKSPESVYRLMRQFFETTSSPLPTRVFVLGIQAEIFEIGEHLSCTSQRALQKAEKYLVQVLNKNIKSPDNQTIS